MQTKTMLFGTVLGGVTFLEVRKRLHHRNANWLRNDEGVGPAHHSGTPRGEERILKKGPTDIRTAAGLAALGVRRADTVGLMLTNRTEFSLCDAAAMHLGAAAFSIYNTSAPEQITYILGNAGNAVMFCDG